MALRLFYAHLPAFRLLASTALATIAARAMDRSTVFGPCAANSNALPTTSGLKFSSITHCARSSIDLIASPELIVPLRWEVAFGTGLSGLVVGLRF